MASGTTGLARLERSTGRRIGVFARDPGSGRTVVWRAEERFAMCSTFKALAVGAVLGNGLPLDRRIRYRHDQVIDYSPITSRHVDDGMTIEALCAAALRYSDNAAANLLLAALGGPARVTSFVRRLGDPVTRLDRTEPTVNTAIPEDPRDTTTPRLIATDLLRLSTGDALDAASRSLLSGWLRTNTTGDAQIRAGVPDTWTVGDKTGSGDYGTANDIGILRAPGHAPIALAVLTTTTNRRAEPEPPIIAQVTRLVVHALGY